MICRLAPQDYHRFHFPVDAKVLNSKRHDGMLFSVNPAAVRGFGSSQTKSAHALSTNKRLTTKMTSKIFGDMLYVSIGATMVGSVIFTSHEGQRVVAGQEHGYMAHGGSTVVIFFEKKIDWRSEIAINSEMGIETVLQMGEPVGYLVPESLGHKSFRAATGGGEQQGLLKSNTEGRAGLLE